MSLLGVLEEVMLSKYCETCSYACGCESKEGTCCVLVSG